LAGFGWLLVLGHCFVSHDRTGVIMADDLVKRLQDYLDCRPWAAGRTFDPTHPECLIAQAKDRIEYLEEVLSVALIYLDDEADVVDGEDGKPVANRAMSVASFIRMGMGNQDA